MVSMTSAGGAAAGGCGVMGAQAASISTAATTMMKSLFRLMVILFSLSLGRVW